MDIAEFTDPRLVAIYDTINAYGAESQPDYYRHLADEVGARTIVDLGCGTGLITCDLAAHGFRMIGVEPAPLMLERARARGRALGDRVQWIEGGAAAIGTPDADLAIMTGHVAQFFVTDESWAATVGALHTALRPGGRLAFETRNPAAREWEGWTRAASWVADDPVAGPIETWSEIDDVRNGTVSYTNHYLFTATGEEVVSRGALRFRTLAELTRSLADAGFTIERVCGDWDGRPGSATDRELIVVAMR